MQEQYQKKAKRTGLDNVVLVSSVGDNDSGKTLLSANSAVCGQIILDDLVFEYANATYNKAHKKMLIDDAGKIRPDYVPQFIAIDCDQVYEEKFDKQHAPIVTNVAGACVIKVVSSNQLDFVLQNIVSEAAKNKNKKYFILVSGQGAFALDMCYLPDVNLIFAKRMDHTRPVAEKTADTFYKTYAQEALGIGSKCSHSDIAALAALSQKSRLLWLNEDSCYFPQRSIQPDTAAQKALIQLFVISELRAYLDANAPQTVTAALSKQNTANVSGSISSLEPSKALTISDILAAVIMEQYKTISEYTIPSEVDIDSLDAMLLKASFSQGFLDNVLSLIKIAGYDTLDSINALLELGFSFSIIQKHFGKFDTTGLLVHNLLYVARKNKAGTCFMARFLYEQFYNNRSPQTTLPVADSEAYEQFKQRWLKQIYPSGTDPLGTGVPAPIFLRSAANTRLIRFFEETSATRGVMTVIRKIRARYDPHFVVLSGDVPNSDEKLDFRTSRELIAAETIIGNYGYKVYDIGEIRHSEELSRVAKFQIQHYTVALEHVTPLFKKREKPLAAFKDIVSQGENSPFFSGFFAWRKQKHKSKDDVAAKEDTLREARRKVTEIEDNIVAFKKILMSKDIENLLGSVTSADELRNLSLELKKPVDPEKFKKEYSALPFIDIFLEFLAKVLFFAERFSQGTNAQSHYCSLSDEYTILFGESDESPDEREQKNLTFCKKKLSTVLVESLERKVVKLTAEPHTDTVRFVAG